MIVLVPYFGDLAKFRPLLLTWLAKYRSSGIDVERHPAVLLSDEPAVIDVAMELGIGAHVVEACDLDGFRDLIRPHQPFDVKGALVCSYLLSKPYPTLVLDADAFLERDPEPVLKPFFYAPVAMPIDYGSICCHRQATLEAPFAGVKKVCAGVQYFGPDERGTSGNSRSRLVAGYRRAFEEIVALPRFPWTPQIACLVEQFAWSVCSHRRGGSILPPVLSWPPAYLGENPAAVINHHFGPPKWALKPASDE